MKTVTQDVFKNADKNILSAAVDSNGEAWFYTCPKSKLMRLNSIWAIQEGVKRYWIGWGYDASNWSESAIDRNSYLESDYSESDVVEL